MQNKIERRKEQVLRMSGVNPLKCMRCGKCSGTCPSYDEMEYHPHQFVYMVETGDIETLMRSRSVYKCLSCFACVDRCPRDVEPAKLIEALRLLAEREKGGAPLTAGDIPALLDSELPQQPSSARCASIQSKEGKRNRAKDRSICMPLRHQHRRHRRCEGCRRGFEA